jgi:hypothetical protein
MDSQAPAVPSPVSRPSPPTIFTRIYEDDFDFLVPNENMSTNERKLRSHLMSEEVQLPQMLTSAQLNAVQLHEPRPGAIIWHKTASGGNPAWLEVTAEQLQSINCLEPLLECREKMLHKDFQAEIAAICKTARGDYPKQKGTTYEWGLTIQPTKGQSSIQMSHIQRESATPNSTTNANKIFCTLLDVCSKAADKFLPEFAEKGRDKRRLAKASLLPGSPVNKYFTSMQVNYSKVYEGLSSLKKFGFLHPDMNDDPTMLTALIVLSHSPPNYSNGRFNVTSLGVSAPLRLCSIYYLSARFFHCGTGHGESSVPDGSPLEIQGITPGLIPDLLPKDDYPATRLTIPVYADKRLMEPKFKWFNQELYTEKGVVIFEDIHPHFKWMMAHYIVHEPEILGRIQYTAAHYTLTYNAAKDVTAEGSGPDQMRQAAISCKPDKKEDPFTLQQRNADVDKYVKLFAYKDPQTGANCYPPRQHAIDTLEAVDTPNPEFENLKQEFEASYCGTTGGGEVQWTRLGERGTMWNAETDKVPSNPEWDAESFAVSLEQLSEAGSLAYAANKVKTAANGLLADAVVRLSRDPAEPDEEAKEAKNSTEKKRKRNAKK